jgi:hypothetical protein
MAQPRLRTNLALVLCCAAIPALAQKAQWQPPTDTSTQASPIKPAPAAHATDSSTQASPVSSGRADAGTVLPHTAIHIRLGDAIDSGRLKNGETLHGTLAETLSLSPHGTVNPGTPVDLTVVETLPAGRLYAEGEFSLQLLQVGAIPVYTDTLTYRGQPGHKDLPDSAPAVGTDAGLPAGAALVFHVLPPPDAASGPPTGRRTTPGSVDGVASGDALPPGSSPAKGKQQNRVEAHDVQPSGQSSTPTESQQPQQQPH